MTEFHVAPQVNPEEGLPYHEWIVAFDTRPSDTEAFAAALDEALQQRNPYYKDLIQGAVACGGHPGAVGPVTEAMRKRGKLGAKTKCPASPTTEAWRTSCSTLHLN